MSSVAATIRAHHADILATWTAGARHAASASGLSASELRNLVPLFLERLGDVRPGGRGRLTERSREVLEEHIATRLRQGFELSEMVEELSLLGRAIARAWIDARPSHGGDPADLEGLFAELDAASQDMTDFVRAYLANDEQLERRFARRLEEMAQSSLAAGAVPLHQRLPEIVALLAETLGAPMLSLLLYDLATEELVASASAGASEQMLALHAPNISTASFAAAVVKHEEPTLIYTAGDDSALIGVRLPLRRRLAGVLFVGVATARAFTARERTRFEAITERLALQLDNDELFAVLAAKVGTLTRERDIREQFTAVLAHDLRGPLANAKLAAEILRSEPESARERPELAASIDRNLDRVDVMIRDLLDTKCLHACGRLRLKLEPCDLHCLLREVVEELADRYGDRFVRVAHGDAKGMWAPSELRRALGNLLDNAIKYGALDAPVTAVVDRVADAVRVSVHNCGPAISAEDEPHLFDAFWRSRHARPGGDSGWGLGLAFVRGCAEAHGGTVAVTSDEASGTTFTLDLPIDARPFQQHSDAH